MRTQGRIIACDSQMGIAMTDKLDANPGLSVTIEGGTDKKVNAIGMSIWLGTGLNLSRNKRLIKFV
jgi:hypothetical protein